MSGNICRCGAYPNIVAAIQQAMGRVMINFQYARASDVADAVRQIAGDPDGEIHRRRHQSDRSDEDGCRAAGAADRHHRGCRSTRSRRPPDGGLRIGALVRNYRSRLSPAGRAALSDAVERDPGRRLAATAQHGVDRRQPAAAHALRLLLRHGDALQQARARQRLLGHRRPSTACNAILGTSEACIAMHPSDMCVALAVLEAKVHVTGAARRARRFAFADFHRLPGDTPQRDTNLERGRDHHRDRAAAAGLRHELHLPEDPRPPVLCVRAGVGRGRRSSSTAARIKEARLALGGVAHKPWRDAAGRSGAARAQAEPNDGDVSHAGAPIVAAARRQGLRRTTPSRSIWRAAPSSAR